MSYKNEEAPIEVTVLRSYLKSSGKHIKKLNKLIKFQDVEIKQLKERAVFDSSFIRNDLNQFEYMGYLIDKIYSQQQEIDSIKRLKMSEFNNLSDN